MTALLCMFVAETVLKRIVREAEREKGRDVGIVEAQQPPAK